jgi:hypothetical protein
VPPPPVYASIHLVAATFCERRKKQVDDLSFSLSLSFLFPPAALEELVYGWDIAVST